MNKNDLISAGKFKELSRSVFNQKISEESEDTYTDCLDEDAEILLAKLLVSGSQEAYDFLLEYQKHYPLGNKAMDLLLSELTDEKIKGFLLQEFKQYGYNEQQGLAVCKAACLLDADFLRCFAKSGRVFYADVYAVLKDLNFEKNGEENLGKVYRKAIVERRKP